MSSGNATIWRSGALVLFMAVMAAVAEVIGQREVIFPEAGALCVGLWLMPKAVWTVRSRQVPLYLTVAATIGLVVNLTVPACFELRFMLAFLVVIALLRWVRCNLYPIVSAAMLPVLIGTTSWLYPLSVLLLASLLAIGKRWFPQRERADYHPLSVAQMVRMALVLAVPLLVVYCIKVETLNFLVVPPLVVTMIEFANRKSGFRDRPWTIWGLIVAAAVVGTAVEGVLHRICTIPMAIGTAIVATVMLLLFRRFKPFAPAMAIAMVPMLLPDGALWWFPLLTAVGGGWFVALGKRL